MEAKKFMDLFKISNWARYFKKVFVFSIVYGLTIFAFRTLLGFFSVPIEMGFVEVAKANSMQGVALLFIIIFELIVAGFFIEFINYSNNKFFKWVQS